MNGVTKNFTEIANCIIYSGLSTKAVYLYCKMKMMSFYTLSKGTAYTESAWMNNNITKKKEFGKRDLFEKCVKELVGTNLINIEKVSLPEFKHPVNNYVILPNICEQYDSTFTMLQNSFINADLDISVKGFAIILLLKGIPVNSKWNDMAFKTGITDKTCKKYISILKEGGYISDNNFFTDKVYIDGRKLYWENKYKYLLHEKRQINGSKQLQKKIDWLDSLDMPYKWKYEKLQIVESGFWNRAKIIKEMESGDHSLLDKEIEKISITL